MKNYLETPPTDFHRELNTLVNNQLVPKTEYTVQDLWVYYNLVWMGQNDSLGKTSSIDPEYRKRRKQLMIERVPELMPTHRQLLEQYVEQWGLPVVLTAIDSHCIQDSPQLPSVEELAYKFRDAQGEINRQKHRSRMM